MKIFLTGYPGLLGKAVAEHLIENGHQVRALMHAKAIDRRDLQQGLTIKWGSLTSHDEFDEYLEGMDAVVHCAWDSRRYPALRFEQTNVEGSTRLLEAASRQGVQTFVHVSSVAVYGLKDPTDESPLTEVSPYTSEADSLDVYPWAKVRTEKALQELCGRAKPRLLIIRPGLLFSDDVAPTRRLVRLFGRTVGLVVGRGRNHLPYVHVRDVADLISRSLRDPSAADVLNAVPSTPIPTVQFLRNWGEARNDPVSVLHMPASVAKAILHAGYYLKRALRRKAFKPNTAYQMRSARRNLIYSCRTAQEKLGWTDTWTQKAAGAR